MGGIVGCVLMRSSNTAVLVPNCRTAVGEGGNGDGLVLIRSALSVGSPIAVGITPIAPVIVFRFFAQPHVLWAVSSAVS